MFLRGSLLSRLLWYDMMWSCWSLTFSLIKYTSSNNFHHMSFWKKSAFLTTSFRLIQHFSCNKNNCKFIANFTLSGIENKSKPSKNLAQQTLHVVSAILQCTESFKIYLCDWLIHWAVFPTEINKDLWIDNQRCPKSQHTGRWQWYRHLLKTIERYSEFKLMNI